jgi:hypothetical protein
MPFVNWMLWEMPFDFFVLNCRANGGMLLAFAYRN